MIMERFRDWAGDQKWLKLKDVGNSLIYLTPSGILIEVDKADDYIDIKALGSKTIKIKEDKGSA